MKRTWQSGAVQTIPTAPNPGSDGYPQEGTGTLTDPATVPGAYWHHAVTEAIVTVIEDAGLVPEDSTTQYRDALRALYGPGGSGVPPGAMMDYGGTAAPAGWLLCDGRAVSRSTYSVLYRAIGDTWGAGDGSTTFNLPDFRRRVAVGSGGAATAALGSTVGSRGGAETVTLQTAHMPSHSHGDGTLATDAEAAHSHGDGTLATDAEAAHSHGDGTLATDAEAAHSHGDGTLSTANAGSHKHTLPTAAGGPLRLTALTETHVAGGVNDDPPMGFAGTHSHDVTGRTGDGGAHSHDVTGRTEDGGAHSHDVTGATGATGGSSPHPNLPPSLVVAKIIKT